jgi:hypothetical protein
MIASGVTLTDQSNTVYGTNAVSLDDVVDGSLTLLLAHEFTHCYSLLEGPNYSFCTP